MNRSIALFVALIACCGSGVVAFGSPVSTIQFPDGKVLNVLGTVGTGSNSAYLDVDFANNAPAGPAFAWKYNFNGTATETDMLNAVAAADSKFTTVWDPSFAGFVDNFSYDTNTGSADPFASDNFSFWASYIGTYNSVNSADSSTQDVNWVFAPLGSDDLVLGDQYDNNGTLLATGVQNLLYGWTINGEFQTTNLTPNLPEVAAPEPASVGLLAIAGFGLLARRRRA